MSYAVKHLIIALVVFFCLTGRVEPTAELEISGARSVGPQVGVSRQVRKNNDKIFYGSGSEGDIFKGFPSDDSAAFERFLEESVKRGDRKIFVPKGVYILGAKIRVKGNIEIHGSGKGTVFYFPFGPDGARILHEDGNLSIKEIRFSGPCDLRAVKSMVGGLEAKGKGSRVDVANCEFSGFGQFALAASDGALLRVRSSYIHHNTQNSYGYGVMVLSGARLEMDDCECEQNRHSVASNGQGTSYRIKNSYFHDDDETYQVGALDTHPGMAGWIEVSDCRFENLRLCLSLSDGGGKVVNNFVKNVDTFCHVRVGEHNGVIYKNANVKGLVFDGNRFDDVKKNYRMDTGSDIVVNGARVK